jgi:hypothetical protein
VSIWGSILWHDDQGIDSVLNQLYCYQLDNPQQIFIIDHLSAYSIKGDDVIYSILREDRRYAFKSFLLIDFSTKVLESNDGNLKNIGKDKRILYKTNHLIIEHSFKSEKRFAESEGWYYVDKQKLIINSC